MVAIHRAQIVRRVMACDKSDMQLVQLLVLCVFVMDIGTQLM